MARSNEITSINTAQLLPTTPILKQFQPNQCRITIDNGLLCKVHASYISIPNEKTDTIVRQSMKIDTVRLKFRGISFAVRCIEEISYIFFSSEIANG